MVAVLWLVTIPTIGLGVVCVRHPLMIKKHISPIVARMTNQFAAAAEKLWMQQISAFSMILRIRLIGAMMIMSIGRTAGAVR